MLNYVKNFLQTQASTDIRPRTSRIPISIEIESTRIRLISPITAAISELGIGIHIQVTVF